MLLQLYKKVYHVHSVVFSDSPCVVKYAKQLGSSVLPVTKRNKYGLPILKWLLITARDSFPSKQIIFINSDILISPFIFEVSHQFHSHFNGSNVESLLPPSFLVLACFQRIQHNGCTPAGLFFCVSLCRFHKFHKKQKEKSKGY